ncbi:MAG: purine-nucleoside phosphorylase, partial [Acidobacteriaceae bacterium]
MSEFYPLEQIDRIADFIRSKSSYHPRIGIILGSGLGALASSVESSSVIPYDEIEDWPVSTVIGHQGHLVIGKLENQEVFVMQGRVHYYEGYSIAQVVLPVRVLQRLEIEILIVTNAAGAVNPAFAPGDLMLISDHINLIG